MVIRNCLGTFLMLFIPTLAWAAGKPLNPIIKPSADQIFSLGDASCALIGDAYVPVQLNKKNQWLVVSRRIKQLRDFKANANSDGAERKFGKLLKAALAYQKETKPVCVLGVPTPTPAPTETPTPTPTTAPVYFEEYTTALTESDVRYMFHRLAYAATAADLAACIGQTAAFCFDNRINVYDAAANDSVYRAASWYFDGDSTTDDYYSAGDITLAGLQQGMAYFMQNTPNQYHAKLAVQLLQDQFAIEFAKMGTGDINERIAERYAQLLLNHAVSGVIKTMISDMTLNPAMQLFLDGANNTKSAPNENLSREYLELYTVGQKSPIDPEGLDQYSNTTDIPQIAKAFTGWKTFQDLDPITGRNEVFMRLELNDFDTSTKYLWQGLPYGGSMVTIWDAMNLAYGHPEFYRAMAKRMLRHYLTLTPSNEHITAIGEAMAATDNLHSGMRKIAVSKEFFEDKGQLQRECLDGMFTISRTFAQYGMPINYSNLQLATLNCQQEFANSPQGPFGWNEEGWANSQTRMATLNDVASRVFSQASNFTYLPIVEAMPEGDRSDPGKVVDHLARIMNVTLTTTQRDLMVEYMTLRALVVDPITDQPTQFELYPWVATDTTKVRRAVTGVAWMIAATSQFSVK